MRPEMPSPSRSSGSSQPSSVDGFDRLEQPQPEDRRRLAQRRHHVGRDRLAVASRDDKLRPAQRVLLAVSVVAWLLDPFHRDARLRLHPVDRVVLQLGAPPGHRHRPARDLRLTLGQADPHQALRAGHADERLAAPVAPVAAAARRVVEQRTEPVVDRRAAGHEGGVEGQVTVQVAVEPFFIQVRRREAVRVGRAVLDGGVAAGQVVRRPVAAAAAEWKQAQRGGRDRRAGEERELGSAHGRPLIEGRDPTGRRRRWPARSRWPAGPPRSTRRWPGR